MILRYVVAAAFVATLMGSGAVVSLVLAALLLRWFDIRELGDLTGAAIQIGAALCIVGIGVRLTIGTWLWLKTRMNSSRDAL